MLRPYFFLLLFFACGCVFAQDSLHKTVPKPGGISKHDSIPKDRHKRNRSLFSDMQELGSSDYLAAIERANDTMISVRNEGEFGRNTLYVFKEITNTNSEINLITENIKGQGNTNVRNQRMYEKVLLRLRSQLEGYQLELAAETKKLTGLRKNLRSIMKDTVFRKMIRDTVIRLQFQTDLKPLRSKFKATDSLLKTNLKILNTHKAENTEKKIKLAEALDLVSDRLEKSGISLLGKEYPNLWQIDLTTGDESPGSFISGKFSVEAHAFSYYFTYTLGATLVFAVLLALLGWVTWYNRKYIARTETPTGLDRLGFHYLDRGIWLPILTVALNVAIAQNLYAPALYIEVLHLLLLVVLSCIFTKQWPRKTFQSWLLLVGVFAILSFMDLFLRVGTLQRCIFILINLGCIWLGLSHFGALHRQFRSKVFFRWANIVFVSLNSLAVLFNLFGRVTLAHTLSLTAVIALTQFIALSAFLRITIEMITLQIYTIRLKRHITTLFDFENLATNARKPLILLVGYLWMVIIASNLNLSETLYESIDDILSRHNKIGSFSFTLGSLILFVAIIWCAHLLEKFTVFFFGGIETVTQETTNKRQFSKLLITRLTLLVVGYLLAISASGMPIDKITIILGALGVGVGLGLQSIVNNFVSGVILIFERPIQIGDVIESGGQSGMVKEIGLRTTKIDTSNGAEVIIPNGNILSQNIVNWTFSNNYKLTEITLSLSGPISHDEITSTIMASLKTVTDVIQDREPELFFDAMGEQKSRIRIKFWSNIYRTEQALSEVRMALYTGFKEKGIAVE
jgi:small-conductance mechanosensitive channel